MFRGIKYQNEISLKTVDSTSWVTEPGSETTSSFRTKYVRVRDNTCQVI